MKIPWLKNQEKGGSMRRRRAQIILFFLTLWGTAIGLPNLRFAPGHWESLKAPPLPDRPSGLLLFLFSLAIGCSLLGISILGFAGKKKREKKDPEMVPYFKNPPMTWLSAMFLVFLFLSVGVLVWWSWPHFDRFDSFSGFRAAEETRDPKPPTPPRDEAQPIPRSTSPPRLSDWPLLWMAGAGFAVFILSIVLHQALVRRGKKGLEMEDRHRPDLPIVQEFALPEFAEGLDLAEPILRCYRDMCTILRSRVRFQAEMTPREFVRALEAQGVREPAILRLTGLFERVRYGGYSPQAQERSEAIRLLGQIQAFHGRRANEI
jgi:hypothetical protein